MVAKKELRHVPLIGRAAELIETIFVDRSDPNSKHKTAEQIKQVQNAYLKNSHPKPLGIFPEGTCTNGECLL